MTNITDDMIVKACDTLVEAVLELPFSVMDMDSQKRLARQFNRLKIDLVIKRAMSDL